MSVSDWSQKILCRLAGSRLACRRSCIHRPSIINFYKEIYESRHPTYTSNTGDDTQVNPYFLSEVATWSWVLTILSWISSIVNSIISSEPPQPFWYSELGVGVKWFVFCSYEDAQGGFTTFPLGTIPSCVWKKCKNSLQKEGIMPKWECS